MNRTVLVVITLVALLSQQASAQLPYGPLRQSLFGAPANATSTNKSSSGSKKVAFGSDAKLRSPGNYTRGPSPTPAGKYSPQESAASGGRFNPFGNQADDDFRSNRVNSDEAITPHIARAPRTSTVLEEEPIAEEVSEAPKKKAVASRPTPNKGFVDAEDVELTLPSTSVRPNSKASKPQVVEEDEPETVVSEPVRRTPISASTGSHVVASPAADRVLMSRHSSSLHVETTGPRRITVGKEAVYRVSIKNSSDSSAEDVVMFVAIPNWAEVVSADGTTGTAGIVTQSGSEGVQWKIASLAALSRQELTLKLIPRKSQPFDLAVQWTCSPTASQVTVEVDEPKLQLSVSGPTEVTFGQQQIYKLTLSNPGNGDAENVTLTLLPLHSDDPPATQKIGRLAAGASRSIEIELAARQAGQLAIRVEATADGNLKSNAQQLVQVRRGELQIVTSGPKAAYAGVPLAYEIRVKNPGDALVRRVNLQAQLPAGAEVLTATNLGQRTTTRGELQWQIDTIAAGSEQVFQVKCVLRNGGNNRFQFAASAESDLNASSEVATNVVALPDLTLEVVDSPGPLSLDQTCVYEVRLRNRGSGAAEGIEIQAFFSDGIEPVGCDGLAADIQSGVCTLRPSKPIAAGTDVVYKIRAKASQAGQHRIRVEVTCKSLGNKITQEDTTLFYADDAVPSPVTATANKETTTSPR